MKKNELRKIYLAAQKNLSLSERNEKSRRLAELFFQEFDLREIRFLHCFLPIERAGEVNTMPIIERTRRDFPIVEMLVPRVNFETNEIENLKLTPDTEFVKNRWQIEEPTRGEIVAATRIDLVLVPLLCFDARGFRVGYGKGFYDKLLSECRKNCLKIGLSYFAPTTEEISDARAFDVKLDFCVTPEKVFGWR